MLSWLFIPTSFEILLNVSNSTLDEFGEIALKKQWKMIEDYWEAHKMNTVIVTETTQTIRSSSSYHF